MTKRFGLGMLEWCRLLSCCMRSPFQYSVTSLMVEMLYRKLNLRWEPMIWSARKWENLFLPKTSLPIRVIALARWDRYVNRPRRTRIRLLRTGSPCQTCQYMSCVIPMAANHSNIQVWQQRPKGSERQLSKRHLNFQIAVGHRDVDPFEGPYNEL